MDTQKITAIVPIRHQSSRLNEKNYLPMNGTPLYHYILNTLRDSELVTNIIVDTDSPVIKAGCMQLNTKDNRYKIHIWDRPDYLCGGGVSTNELINCILEAKNIPEVTGTDIFIQTHVTNPLLKASTIDDALNKFIEYSDKYDSIFSVSRMQTRLYDSDGHPINHDPHKLIQTQIMAPIYEDNSCFYIFTRDSFNKKVNRIGSKPYFYVIESREESLDIDWKEDFILGELYLQRRELLANQSKTVLITGANGGIGFATCKKFKQKGWRVIGTDLNNIDPDSQLYRLCDRYIQSDLANRDQEGKFPGIEKIINTITVDENGKLDALVNVAALQLCQSVSEIGDKEWDQIMNCNLRAPFELARQSVSFLIKAGTGGSIVNVSSIHSIQTSPKILAYAVSKAALSGLTRSLAIELGSMGIRVNAVCPGAIDTNMLRAGLVRQIPESYLETGTELNKLIEEMGKKHLMGKIGQPEDIASAIYFLADSNESGFILGENLVVDGGCTIRLSTE